MLYLVELGNLVDCKYNNSIVVWLLEGLMRAYATLLERCNNLIYCTFHRQEHSSLMCPQSLEIVLVVGAQSRLAR